MSKKRICIDLDGVINNLKNSEQDYSEVTPVKEQSIRFKN